MNAAQQLASMRKTADKNCVICGAVFHALARAETCSNACRQKRKYRKKKGSG